MAKLTEEIILKALSTVQDPSQGSDIVALNLVTAIQIKDTNISFALQVPPHQWASNGAGSPRCGTGRIAD